MAESTVLIKIVTRGERKAEKLRETLDRTKTVTRQLDGQLKQTFGGAATRRIDRATTSLDKFGKAAQKANKPVDGLAKAVRGFATAAAVLGTVKFALVKTAELETQTRSLQVLTGSLDTAKDIIKELQDFGAVTPFTSTELIDTAKRLKAFGVDTEILVETTKRLGDVAGATGAELNGIATAYGQITAKGKLQTEELLQLQERGVDIATILKKEYNLTGEEFSKALQKGQISAEAVEFALKKLTDTGGKYADGAIAQSDTLAGKFSTLTDGITRIAQSLTQILVPALKNVLDFANAAISSINTAFQQAGQVNVLIEAGEITAQEAQKLRSQAQDEALQILKSGLQVPKPGESANAALQRIANNIFEGTLTGLARNAGLIKDKIQTPEVQELPELLGGNNKSGSSSGRVKGLDKSVDAVKRLAKELALATEEEIQAIQNQDQIIDRLNLQVAIAGEKNELKKLELGYLLDILELEQEIKNRSEGASAIRIQQLNQEYDLRRKIIDEQFDDNFYSAGFAMGAALADDLSKVNTELTDTEQLLGNSFDIVAGGLTDGIKGLIDGTKEWNDVLGNVLASLGDMLLQFGLSSLKSSLIPGFAEGGVLPSNGPAIVGENGPELVMSSGGQSRVFSNRDSQAALQRYNPSNARSIEELAMAGGGSTKSEWGGASQPMQTSINIEGGVMQFNDTNYIRQDQVPSIITQASKQGEARALRKLQMSPAARRRAGI